MTTRGQLREHLPAAAGARSGQEPAAERGHTLGHARDAEAGTLAAGQAADTAVVDDPDVDVVVLDHHRHVDACGSDGMALRVGERFTDDAVDGHVQLGWQHGLGRVDPQAHGQAELGGAVGEGAQVGQRCCGCERCLGTLFAQRTDHPPHRGECLCAGVLDRLQRSGRRIGIAVCHQPCGLCLHDDASDVVGDDVVQLAGDREAFVMAGLIRLTDLEVVDPAQVAAGRDRGDQPGGEDGLQLGAVRPVLAEIDQAVQRHCGGCRRHERMHAGQRPHAPADQEPEPGQFGESGPRPEAHHGGVAGDAGVVDHVRHHHAGRGRQESCRQQVTRGERDGVGDDQTGQQRWREDVKNAFADDDVDRQEHEHHRDQPPAGIGDGARPAMLGERVDGHAPTIRPGDRVGHARRVPGQARTRRDRPFGREERASRPMRSRSRVRHDRSMRTTPTRTLPHTIERTQPVELALRVAAGGVVGGIALGGWCRWAGETRDGRSVMGILSQLGAPWILAAFAIGAVVVTGVRVQPRVAIVAGGVAGAAALVVATYVYYGPARTGGVGLGGAELATVSWTVGSIVVGGIFGVLAAVWTTSPRSRFAAVAAAGVGTAVASEAAFHLRIGSAGDEAAIFCVLVTLVAVGLAVPFALLRDRRTLPMTLVVALMCLPASLIAEQVNGTALDAGLHVSRSLRTFFIG
jgi:hypothetical protein